MVDSLVVVLDELLQQSLIVDKCQFQALRVVEKGNEPEKDFARKIGQADNAAAGVWWGIVRSCQKLHATAEDLLQGCTAYGVLASGVRVEGGEDEDNVEYKTAPDILPPLLQAAAAAALDC